MSSDLSEEIINELNTLNPEAQRRVLEFVRSLKPLTPGMSGLKLRQFFGIMSTVDAQEMMNAIQSGCENVDIDECV
jgi:hypothetical protein